MTLGNYRCRTCGAEWIMATGPQTCPACGGQYVTWTNYSERTATNGQRRESTPRDSRADGQTLGGASEGASGVPADDAGRSESGSGEDDGLDCGVPRLWPIPNWFVGDPAKGL